MMAMYVYITSKDPQNSQFFGDFTFVCSPMVNQTFAPCGRFRSGDIQELSVQYSCAICRNMLRNITEFCILKSSNSTVGGGVGFLRGCYFLLVDVAVFGG